MNRHVFGVLFLSFPASLCNAVGIEQTLPHVASYLPALVYGTAFIHWELDFFNFYNKHLYK